MAQINALSVVNAVRRRMVDFALSDHYVRDEKMRRACEAVWSGPAELGGLGSDLWVEGAFPSKQGPATLGDLVESGIINRRLGRHLDSRGAFPLARRPFTHQWASIQAAHEGYAAERKPAIVVTAATGTGKTESFLLPVLQDVYTHESEPGQGVSCIILYPMNALVNDQVDRLYAWLQGQEVATLFHFTSETPEDGRAASSRGTPVWDRCRFRTRRHARGLERPDGKAVSATSRGPVPRIVITNYSMLEYMLCRPQDSVLFGRNLRTVVLDEAHLYTGNLAAEMALLLRRLYLKCGVTGDDVVQFATSATIGSGTSEGGADLRAFAQTLFGKPDSQVHVIQGEADGTTFDTSAGPEPTPVDIAAQSWPDSSTVETVDGETRFVDCPKPELRQWQAALGCLVPKALVDSSFRGGLVCPIAPLLAELLVQSPVFARLHSLVWQRRCARLADLASELFGGPFHAANEATRVLLQLGASARPSPSAHPLLPNRVHYLVRAPEGLSFSFLPENAPSAEACYGTLGYVVSAGALGPDPKALGACLSLVRCALSGTWLLAGVEDRGSLREVPLTMPAHHESDVEWPPKVRFFSVEEVPGAARFVFSPQNGTLSGAGSPGVVLWAVDECPATGIKLQRSARFFNTQSNLHLSLLAETVLMEMPALEGEESQWKPGRGRRLLIFSDSRSEAARLGPGFTRQHEIQVFRAAVASTIARGEAGGPEMVEFHRQEAIFLRQQLAATRPGSAAKAHAKTMLDECESRLAQSSQGGAMAAWEELVCRDPRLHEILDLEHGLRHTAADWTQIAWFENHAAVKAGVRNLMAREFMRRAPWPSLSLETAGLVEVVYPGVEGMGMPDTAAARLPREVREKLEPLWPDFLAAILDVVRAEGAITLGSRALDLGYEYGALLVGKNLSERTRDQSYVFPMVSVTGRSNRHRLVMGVLTNAGLDEFELDHLSEHILSETFRQLHSSLLPCLIAAQKQARGVRVDTLQINFNQLALRAPLRCFQCINTGQVWPRSILGLYPGVPRGSLREISPSDLDCDPRIGRARQDWLRGQVFQNGLWAEEHSAQLGPKESGRIQNLFKAGIRNILSSTTTLELGIDIGGLNGVLMGNIPPGKANYLQRAGPAGRRADGSSVVFSLARATPYERDVFLHFGAYLDQSLRRPLVFLDRAEIVRRHLSAMFLGDFFLKIYGAGKATGAMDAFGTVGKFYRESRIPYWERGEQKPAALPCQLAWSLPAEPWVPPDAAGLSLAELFILYLRATKDEGSSLRARAATLTAGTPLAAGVARNWSGLLDEIAEHFGKAFIQWRTDYGELRQRWDQIATDELDARRSANAIYHQMRTYYDLTVIETLADNLFLPRYGFPIGLSRLRVAVPDELDTGRVREEDQFRLQRSSMLALREYAPDSQVLVGNRVVTSRGLLKHWTGHDVSHANMGLRGWYVRDMNTGNFRYSLVSTPAAPEHAEALAVESGQMIFARHGFTSAAWDPPRFGTESERVGIVYCYTTAFTDGAQAVERVDGFGAVPLLTTLYRAGGEILLLNEGEERCGFAVCLKCGYGDSEKHPAQQSGMNLPKHFDAHSSLFSSRDRGRCWKDDEVPVLRNQRLAARQVSNLVLFDLSPWLVGRSPVDRTVLLTLGQALRLVGARLLQIDAREVIVLEQFASPLQANGAGLILYDAVAGGSGHTREMLALGRAWLQATVDYLDVRSPDGAYDDRQAIRRLLTADIVRPGGDVLLMPRQAHEVLRDILSNRVRRQTQMPLSPGVDPQEVIARALARAGVRQTKAPDLTLEAEVSGAGPANAGRRPGLRK